MQLLKTIKNTGSVFVQQFRWSKDFSAWGSNDLDLVETAPVQFTHTWQMQFIRCAWFVYIFNVTPFVYGCEFAVDYVACLAVSLSFRWITLFLISLHTDITIAEP